MMPLPLRSYFFASLARNIDAHRKVPAQVRALLTPHEFGQRVLVQLETKDS